MKIDLVPFCGLGNRLNTISSAIALHKACGHKITVYWEKSWDCSAWFEDLFLPLTDVSVEHLDKFYLKRRGKRYLMLPRLLRLFIYDKSLKARKIWNSNLLTHPPKQLKYVYIDGNKRFCPLEETHLLAQYYKPIPPIQQKIDAITRQYADFTIGVHIRRTDHREVIKNNPLENYIKAIQTQLELHPDCKCYLASDDPMVKEAFARIFPDQLITNDCNLSRSAKEGIQDAVTELFLLGKCQLIIGSKGSTFSELAAKLYDTPIIYPQ